MTNVRDYGKLFIIAGVGMKTSFWVYALVTIWALLPSLFVCSMIEASPCLASGRYPDSVSQNASDNCNWEEGPELIFPPDRYSVKYVWNEDSGLDLRIDLRWNLFCSATCYELQIGKDDQFNLFVYAWYQWNKRTGFKHRQYIS